MASACLLAVSPKYLRSANVLFVRRKPTPSFAGCLGNLLFRNSRGMYHDSSKPLLETLFR